jgi:hypothetical protein
LSVAGDLARNEDQSLFENLLELSTLAVSNVAATGAEAIRAASIKSTQKHLRWPKKSLGRLGHLGRHGRLAKSRKK